MEGKKESAIEWLIDKLEDDISLGVKHYNQIIEQAKAMEKEQIVEFANKVIYNAECSFTGRAYLEKDINEIYNETYGK